MEYIRKITKSHVLGNSIRLGIMIYLLPRGRALFKELQSVLEITPGNLDSHLKVLKKEEYVEMKKVILDRPRTALYITDYGAKETREYLSILRQMIDSTESEEP